MAKIIKCDRCGKIFETYNKALMFGESDTYNGIDFTSIDRRDNYDVLNRFDLCEECAGSFKKWIAGAD